MKVWNKSYYVKKKRNKEKELKVNSTNLVRNLKRILFTSCHLNLLPDQKKLSWFFYFWTKKTQNTIKLYETLPIRWSNKEFPLVLNTICWWWKTIMHFTRNKKTSKLFCQIRKIISMKVLGINYSTIIVKLNLKFSTTLISIILCWDTHVLLIIYILE